MKEFLIKLHGSPVGYAADEFEGDKAAAVWLARNADNPAAYEIEELADGLDYQTAGALLPAIMEREGITVESEFVPFSKSRNAGEDHRTLNWLCTVKRRDRALVERVPYSAGVAHCPYYKRAKLSGKRPSVLDAQALEFETERGREAPRTRGGLAFGGTKAIEPDAADVLGSLAQDSDVLDYGSFEDWAGEFGYSEDSRTAERTYTDCLSYALSLRAGLGDPLLGELRAVARAR